MIVQKFKLFDEVKFSSVLPADADNVFKYVTSTGCIIGAKTKGCCSIIYTIACDSDGDNYESFENQIELLGN